MADSTYLQADALLRKGDLSSIEEALRLLHQEVENRPSDAKAWFELAGGYDFLGREAEALPHYQRVVVIGVENLPQEDQPRLYVQLGSTLRNLLNFSESRKVLQEGIERYPKTAALKAFLGLTEYTAGNAEAAAKLFLESALIGTEPSGDGSLKDYSRALRNYLQQIDTFPCAPAHKDDRELKEFMGMPMKWNRKAIFKNFWNSDDDRIFPPKQFGVGWDINFHALFREMKLLKPKRDKRMSESSE